MALGSRMLQELGGRENDIAGLTRALRKQLDARSHEMMQILRNELPAPAITVSEEDEVFVFDQGAVSKADLPTQAALATPQKSTVAPRGQETAAAMGLQEAPADQPVVVTKQPHEERATASKMSPEAEANSNHNNGPLTDEQLRMKYRDGSDSCPIDDSKEKETDKEKEKSHAAAKAADDKQ